MLVPDRMARVRIQVHSAYTDSVLHELAEAGCIEIIDVKQSVEDFEGRLKPLEASDKLFRISSLASRASVLLENLRAQPPQRRVPVEGSLSDERLGEMEKTIVLLEQQTAKLQARLLELERSEQRSSEEEAEIEKVKGELEALGKQVGDDLYLAHELLEIERKVESSKTFIGATSRTNVIEGWVPLKRIGETNKIVKNSTDGCYAFTLLPVELSSHEEHGRALPNPPPTLLSNPKIAQVFETLTKSFGIPNYAEIDPTVIMLFSFPLIFGLMFGDVGHGAIVTLAGFALTLAERRGMRAGEIGGYFLKGSRLIFLCGISSIFFGFFLYDEFFGAEAWHFFGLEAPRMLLGPFKFPVHLMEEPMEILRLAIYIAMIHISLGLVLQVVNHIRSRRYRQALVGPVMWLWFYWSAVGYPFLTYGSKMLQVYLSDIMFLLLFLILPFATMMVSRIAVHKMEGFGETLESALSSISNTISYARILALAMAHASFSLMIYRMASSGSAVFVALAAFLTVLVVSFEGLLVFMHTLRLHWVEWFLKFYSGTGVPYDPFTAPRTFTYVAKP
jgi:V/A-type H+-transporting ATPase subunit I